MIPFIDGYLHVKNLRDHFITSKDIDDQRTMQSGCLRAF